MVGFKGRTEGARWENLRLTEGDGGGRLGGRNLQQTLDLANLPANKASEKLANWIY